MQRALVVGMSLVGLYTAGMADGLVPPAAEGAIGSTGRPRHRQPLCRRQSPPQTRGVRELGNWPGPTVLRGPRPPHRHLLQQHV